MLSITISFRSNASPSQTLDIGGGTIEAISVGRARNCLVRIPESARDIGAIHFTLLRDGIDYRFRIDSAHPVYWDDRLVIDRERWSTHEPLQVVLGASKSVSITIKLIGERPRIVALPIEREEPIVPEVRAPAPIIRESVPISRPSPGKVASRPKAKKSQPPRVRQESFVPAVPTDDHAAVHCSVFSPPVVQRATPFLIQAALHAEDDAASAIAIALEADAGAKRRWTSALEAELRQDERVELRLAGDGLAVEKPAVKLTWRGRIVSASFVTRFASAHVSSTVAQLRVLVDGRPIGSAAFTIEARDGEPAAAKPQAHRFAKYKKVFLSYASTDRVEVLKDNLLLKRLGLEVFQDILTLDAGERWERALYRNIDEADLFLLYWSKAAAKSEWVCKEAEYALARQTLSPQDRPDIVPILLEGPPPPAPPPALGGIHFNDPIVYVIAAEQNLDRARTSSTSGAADS